LHPNFAGGNFARTRFLLVPRRNDNLFFIIDYQYVTIMSL
jgi:hypothetical protein